MKLTFLAAAGTVTGPAVITSARGIASGGRVQVASLLRRETQDLPGYPVRGPEYRENVELGSER